MKKIYQTPMTRVIALATERMLAESDPVRSNANLKWSKSLEGDDR